MRDFKRPIRYDKMIKNILKSFKEGEYSIVMPPTYLGNNGENHIFFSVIREIDSHIGNTDHTAWLDYVTPNGEIYDSNSWELDDEFKLVVKGLLSKEFRTYNILHGTN